MDQSSTVFSEVAIGTILIHTEILLLTVVESVCVAKRNEIYMAPFS